MGRITVLPPERTDEAYIKDERRADRFRSGIIGRKDRLPRSSLAEPVELYARAIHTTRAKSLEVSCKCARDLDLPFSKQNTVDKGIRVDLENTLVNVPPLLGWRVCL